jgi:hypothetical protein
MEKETLGGKDIKVGEFNTIGINLKIFKKMVLLLKRSRF